MHRANFKKWVGLLILAITLCLGFQYGIQDVYAEYDHDTVTETCKQTNYGVEVTNNLDSTGEIKIKINNGNNKKFNIKIMTEDTYNYYISTHLPGINWRGSYDIKGVAQFLVTDYRTAKSNLNDQTKKIYKNYTLNTKKGKTATLTKDKISNANNGAAFPDINNNVDLNAEEGTFYIIIYPTTYTDCTLYWYDVREISFTNEVVPQGNVTSAYLDDIASGKNVSADKNFENHNYCAWANKVYEESDNTFKNILGKTMVSCFPNEQGKVSYNFTKEALKNIATQVKDLYEAYKKYLKISNGKNQLSELDSRYNWQKIEKPSEFKSSDYSTLGSKKNDMLTCDTKDEETYKYMYYTESKDYSANYQYGTQGKRSSHVCSVTCREHLIVKFGPPKAIIAGQCFTYEVEIESKVECISNLDVSGVPNANEYTPAIVVPKCSNSSTYGDQAGPNDDFDNCVKSCDDGQYTQKCINKCYKEVYKNSNNDKVAFEAYKKTTLDMSKMSGSKSTQVSNTCPAGTIASVRKDSNGKPLNEDKGNVESIVKAVYNMMWQQNTGNYSENNSKIVYTPGLLGGGQPCKWYDYSYYYFYDLPMAYKTVCNDYGYNWDGNNPLQCQNANYSKKDCSATKKCYRGKIGGAGYLGVNGFKERETCDESCTWIKFNNNEINRFAAETQYITDLKEFVSQAVGCVNKASAECKKNNSKYQMTVNYDQKEDKQTCTLGDDNSNCKTWTAEGNKTGNSVITKDDSILISNGGSCMSGDDTWMYHDILTFPGSWINNKNGKVVYEKPNNENWYTQKEGNYCTPLNAKGVNAPYWRWYQNTKSGVTNKTFDSWARKSDINEIKYNILSSIAKFGHYNWTFNVGCFYAIDSDTPTTECTNQSDCPPTTKCDDKVCPSCTNSHCPNDGTPTNKFNDYTSKSITSSDMFPSKSSNKTSSTNASKLSYVEKLAGTNSTASSSAGRAKGFNWSVESTNLAIEGYPVTPSALVNKIENTELYSEDEVDYDITLTTANIRKIRSESGEDNYYTSYSDGTYTTVTGKNYPESKYDSTNTPSYTYYMSKFLRDSSYVSTRRTIPSKNGLPCNNLKSSNSCDITLSNYVNSDQKLIEWLR